MKRVSRRLSRDLVAITSTAAPGKRTGDKRKNYDKADFYSDEMPNSGISIVTVGSLSSLQLPITTTPSDMGQGEHSDKLGNNKDKTMNVNQILTAVGVLVAIAAVFVGQLAAYSALILVVFGIDQRFHEPNCRHGRSYGLHRRSSCNADSGQPTGCYSSRWCAVEQHYRQYRGNDCWDGCSELPACC